jgi:hypothetical protein
MSHAHPGEKKPQGANPGANRREGVWQLLKPDGKETTKPVRNVGRQ